EIHAAMLTNQRRGKRIKKAAAASVSPVARATTSEGINKQIRGMRRANMTYDAIAASLGMTKSNVWYRCRKMHLPR
ncbi:MAG TPA: hypothetical protein VHC71_13795, partial [Hyphomicrobium sp.]|nr:hypothetical protein [Hyphomicrobium sp.]